MNLTKFSALWIYYRLKRKNGNLFQRGHCGDIKPRVIVSFKFDLNTIDPVN